LTRTSASASPVSGSRTTPRTTASSRSADGGEQPAERTREASANHPMSFTRRLWEAAMHRVQRAAHCSGGRRGSCGTRGGSGVSVRASRRCWRCRRAHEGEPMTEPLELRLALETKSNLVDAAEIALRRVEGVAALSRLYEYELTWQVPGDGGLSPEALQDLL